MRLRPLHLTLLGVLVALVIFGIATLSGPPAPKPLDAPLDEFSAARALQIIHGLTATGLPHPTGSPDNERVRGYIHDRLRALGLEPTEQVANACSRYDARCAEAHNLLARIEGTEAGPALLLVAHYDSAEFGPGAADDGAGVSTILEIVRILKLGPPPRRTVIVLIDDGEELGLLGATAFVTHHPWARDVRVVLNFEARGNTGPTAMFEACAACGWLFAEYARAVSRPFASSFIYTLYKQLPNDTDLTVFKAAGMLGLNFAFADHVSDYHTANDTAARLDLRSVQHMGDQGLAVTRALASTDLSRPPDADVVYFDLFSRAVIFYRTRWVLPLAALGLGAALAAIAAALRAGRVSPAGIACGVGVQLAVLIAGAATVFAVPALIEVLARRPNPWWTEPRPTWAALLSALVAAGSAVEIGLGRRLFSRVAGPEDDGAVLPLWAGSVVFWVALSVIVAIIAPEASYLFTLPAMAVALGLLLAAYKTPDVSGWRTFGGLALGIGVTALLWMPIVWVLRMMIGPMMPHVGAFPVVLMVIAAAPVFLAASGRARWGIPITAAGVMLVASGVAIAAGL